MYDNTRQKGWTSMQTSNSYFQPGSFFVGANYWASNAGTNMWRMFDVNAIRDDHEELKKRFKKDKATFYRIAGCYVNEKKERISYVMKIKLQFV